MEVAFLCQRWSRKVYSQGSRTDSFAEIPVLDNSELIGPVNWVYDGALTYSDDVGLGFCSFLNDFPLFFCFFPIQTAIQLKKDICKPACSYMS